MPKCKIVFFCIILLLSFFAWIGYTILHITYQMSANVIPKTAGFSKQSIFHGLFMPLWLSWNNSCDAPKLLFPLDLHRRLNGFDTNLHMFFFFNTNTSSLPCNFYPILHLSNAQYEINVWNKPLVQQLCDFHFSRKRCRCLLLLRKKWFNPMENLFEGDNTAGEWLKVRF